MQDTQIPEAQPNEDHGITFNFNDRLCDNFPGQWSLDDLPDNDDNEECFIWC